MGKVREKSDHQSSQLLFSCSKQLLPKSMTLMALLAGCFNRTFCVSCQIKVTGGGSQKRASGFKSQWTILWWRIKHKDMII